MKNSIVLLGMALLVFNMTTAANIAPKVNTVSVAAVDNEQGDFFSGDNPLENRNFAPVEDEVILNPDAVMYSSEKSIEEIIAENNQITESKITDEGVRYFTEKPIETIIQENNRIIESQDAEIRPLYLDRTIEDQIAEDNAIIESELSAAFQPLNFETINKKAFSLKQNTNKLVGIN